MKILVATGVYPPDIGGPATYSQLLREKLPERGIEVKILTFGEVRYLPKVIRHLVFLCKAVIRGRGCDIIYAQDPVSVGLPSFFAAKLLFKKFFIRVAGDYAWEQAVQRYGIKDSIDDFQRKKYGFKTEFLRLVQRFVVGRADKVITPSLYFKNLVSGWNRRQKNIFHIYNGIEFPEKLPSKEEARRALHIPDDSIAVISAGRLVPWKGFASLMKAVERLVEEDGRYRLYILGAGPDKEVLAESIEKRRLKGNAFLVGAVSREKIFAYLSAADVFVLNTSFESFSFQIVEAMHAGAPVVSTNIGNIPEVVQDGKEGLLVAPNDIEALCRSIRRIISDADFRERLISAAKEKSNQFSIEKTLDKLCELFLR